MNGTLKLKLPLLVVFSVLVVFTQGAIGPLVQGTVQVVQKPVKYPLVDVQLTPEKLGTDKSVILNRSEMGSTVESVPEQFGPVDGLK